LKQINPHIQVTKLPLDCTTLDWAKATALFAPADLLLFTVDRFAADAWGNELALRLGTPALWVGLYAGAGAGEIAFWHRGLDACFRCLMERRYAIQAEARQESRTLDPPSDGALFQDLMIVDGIASHIALGLLTMGADNYFGRLIGELGDRNFLQIKLRHDWTLDGGDPVRRVLGVSDDNSGYFAWNTVARANGPMFEPCPDCEQHRGHRFVKILIEYFGPDAFLKYRRLKPGEAGYDDIPRHTRPQSLEADQSAADQTSEDS
jgi:hypothetical protein